MAVLTRNVNGVDVEVPTAEADSLAAAWAAADAAAAAAIPVKLAEEARADRDNLINAIYWRIQRYEGQVAAGATPTETSGAYQALLTYVQALRDVPSQAGFPTTIDWPVAP